MIVGGWCHSRNALVYANILDDAGEHVKADEYV